MLVYVHNMIDKAADAVVEVTRTYLQLESPEQLNEAGGSEPAAEIKLVHDCPSSFFRYLYTEVGRRYYWTDRLGWTDEQIRRYLSTPDVSIWVMYMGGAPAGYFELKGHDDGSTEIAYFGLLQEFIGRGLGKYLLSYAVSRAWETGANRVWLHTCTLDDPAAMPNYLKRGFRPFNTESYMARIPTNLVKPSR